MADREILDAADNAKAAATLTCILSDKLDAFEKNIDLRFCSLEEKIDKLEKLLDALDRLCEKKEA